MKLKPTPQKIAAATALLIAATTGPLTIVPAHAASSGDTDETKATATAVKPLDKYNLASFSAPELEEPKTGSWAVAFTPSSPDNEELDPAQAALLEKAAKVALEQKATAEKAAAKERAKQKLIEEKAAAEKAAAEKAAAEAAAAEKAAKEKAEKEAREAEERKAAEEAEALAAAEAAARAAAATAITPASSPAANGAPAAAATGPSAPMSGLTGTRANVIQTANKYLGVPYVWGGTTPSGWDCSGFVQYVYNEIGIGLPRTTNAQVAATRQVSAAEAQPGDLVMWSDGGNAYHVAIYAGGNTIIHAPVPGQSTQVSPIWGNPTFHSVL